MNVKYFNKSMLGIDIGSTTVSINLADCQTGAVIKAVTLPDDSRIKGEPYESLYDTDKIMQIVYSALSSFSEDCMKNIACIGVTGQMHGVIYTDRDGNAVSPLYSWMDGSGDVKLDILKGKSCAEYIRSECGCKAAAGWGLTTVFFHSLTDRTPVNAFKICSVPDYVAMKLAGCKEPVMHVSDAASFGLFDIKSGSFRTDLISKLGIDVSLIPEVTDGYDVLGEYNGIPVCVAIGDNQAGFISSVDDFDNTVLANIGTGSQVSFAVSEPVLNDKMELRPLVRGKYILAGSALCGGRALSVLERFLRACASFVTGSDVKSAYPAMDKYLDSLLDQLGDDAVRHSLDVSTLFNGNREDPFLRGAVTGISTDNFTPEEMIKGFMFGMCDELCSMYEQSGVPLRSKLVGSGNAVRKSRFLQKALEKEFGAPLRIPAHTEEAAYGAAMFASVCVGINQTLEEAQSKISYS